MKPQKFDLMADEPHPKVARPDHDILDVIRDRWSPRAFDASKPVSDADVRRLFEAARWAPSSRNEQPWRFVLVDRGRTPDTYEGLFASLFPRNQAWAAAAPLLVLVAVRLTHEHDEVVNSHAWYDAGQAVGFLTLQATSMGLGVRQMQGFNRDAAAHACNVPEPFEAGVVMAVGHVGDPQLLESDRFRAAELAPRERRAMSEFVFDGVWGQALT